MFITDSDIEDGPPDCILGQRGQDTIGELIRFHEALGLDIMLRIGVNVFEPIAFDVNTDDWLNSWHPSNNGRHLIHEITTPDGKITETFYIEGEVFHGDPSQDWMKLRNVRTEPLIKTPEDLAIAKKYRPQIPTYDLSHISNISERLGDRGIVLPRVPSSVFNSAYGLRKLEDLFMDPILRPDLYQDLMEFCTNDVIAAAKQIVKGGGDLQRIVGNVANSGMVSPQFYLEHVYPYEKRYVDSLTSQGSKVLFHNCGQCAALLDVYGKMLDGQALESLSTAGSGGDIVCLKSARESLGENVVMVGNFDQVHLLKEGTQQDITKRVRQIFEETQGDKRFIFSTSDSIIPGTPGENVRAMVDAALECAG
jgi:hypothetical protein